MFSPSVIIRGSSFIFFTRRRQLSPEFSDASWILHPSWLPLLWICQRIKLKNPQLIRKELQNVIMARKQRFSSLVPFWLLPALLGEISLGLEFSDFPVSPVDSVEGDFFLVIETPLWWEQTSPLEPTFNPKISKSTGFRGDLDDFLALTRELLSVNILIANWDCWLWLLSS